MLAAHKLADFDVYACRWIEGGIIRRCGGQPMGYFFLKKGYGSPDNIATALIGFESLPYRVAENVPNDGS